MYSYQNTFLWFVEDHVYIFIMLISANFRERLCHQMQRILHLLFRNNLFAIVTMREFRKISILLRLTKIILCFLLRISYLAILWTRSKSFMGTMTCVINFSPYSYAKVHYHIRFRTFAEREISLFVPTKIVLN